MSQKDSEIFNGTKRRAVSLKQLLVIRMLYKHLLTLVVLLFFLIYLVFYFSVFHLSLFFVVAQMIINEHDDDDDDDDDVAEGRWNMIYGVSQPNTSQQRRSFRSFLYTKVIPRSQRAANVSRDNMAAADTQQAPRQDLHPQVGLMYLELLTYIFFQ